MTLYLLKPVLVCTCTHFPRYFQIQVVTMYVSQMVHVYIYMPKLNPFSTTLGLIGSPFAVLLKISPTEADASLRSRLPRCPKH